MYEKMDSTNDGLMNAETWKVDMTRPGIIGFDALIQSLENAVKNNPKTTFIACHFANLNHDIDKLAGFWINTLTYMQIFQHVMLNQQQFHVI